MSTCLWCHRLHSQRKYQDSTALVTRHKLFIPTTQQTRLLIQLLLADRGEWQRASSVDLASNLMEHSNQWWASFLLPAATWTGDLWGGVRVCPAPGCWSRMGPAWTGLWEFGGVVFAPAHVTPFLSSSCGVAGWSSDQAEGPLEEAIRMWGDNIWMGFIGQALSKWMPRPVLFPVDYSSVAR